MSATQTLFDNLSLGDGEDAPENDNSGRKHVRRVGWIPEEWDALQLGELLSLRNGKSRPDEMSDTRTGKYNTPVYGGNGVMGYAQKQLVEGPRIIIGRVGALCGVVHLARGEYWVSDNAMYTQNLEGLNIPPRFLWYLLDFSNLGRYRQESSQPLITQRIVKQKKVPLPTSQEQYRIAKILDDWSHAIEQVNTLIKEKQKQLHGLRQRLLIGEVRFPTCIRREGKQDAEFGIIPLEWDYVPIGKIASEKKEINEDGEDITVLSCTKHEGLVDSLEYFDRQVFSDDTSDYKIVNQGDFAYATNHIEEGSIGVQDMYDRGLVSPMYTVFSVDREEVSIYYLDELFETELYRQIFERWTNGTVSRRGALRWEDFSTIKVPVPPLLEQHKIVNVLNAAKNEIQKLKEKRQALERQKRGLMQRLLTGAVRTV